MEPDPQETEVVRALQAGSSSGGICRSLRISRDTLKTQLRHVFEKTGANGRAQLVALMLGGPNERS